MENSGTQAADARSTGAATGPLGRPAAVRARRRTVLAGAALATALLTASCGYGDNQAASQDGNVRPVGDSSDADPGYGSDGGYGGSGDYGGKDDGAGGGDSAQGGSRSGPAKTLTLQDSPKLGQVVTDSEGWTLYRFDKDSAEPPASNCNDDCAATWPPVPAEEASASAGIQSDKLGRVRRDDGSWQLTLGGWPVYRYAQDTSPGDTKGHGVGGTWNALAPDGGKAGAQSAPEAGGSEPATQLRAVDDASLGTVLRDAKGRTLYRFDKDSAWPMKSNCTGACLETWKPAKPVDKDRIEGVARKLVSTYKRADGTKQLAIDCWPVYWFTGDKAPGDTDGHGKQGLWWAVTDKGGKAGKAG